MTTFIGLVELEGLEKKGRHILFFSKMKTRKLKF